MRSVVLLTGCVLASFGCSDAGPDGTTPAGPSETGSAANKGNEAMAEYLKRDSTPFRKNRVRFTITTENEPQKVYEIDTLRKQGGNDTLTLTQIVKPAAESDLASLTVESEGTPTSVSTYVASMNEFRETDTGRMFFGGLTAGELLGEWNKFDYRLLGEKMVDGQQLLELEGKLKKPGSSLIARMHILMRADNYVPVELHMFDAGGRQLRTYRVTEVASDSKGAYAARTEIENPIYKSKVLVEVLNREFPTEVEAAFFTRDRLKQIAASR
jgi:Outer membrane lipoprotein-sorting protein